MAYLISQYMLIFNGILEWLRWASVKSCFSTFHFTLRQIKIDRAEIPRDWTGLRLEIIDVTRSRGNKSGRDKGFILCQPGCMSDLLKAPFGMKKDSLISQDTTAYLRQILLSWLWWQTINGTPLVALPVTQTTATTSVSRIYTPQAWASIQNIPMLSEP